jgi:hypothetical protein
VRLSSSWRFTRSKSFLTTTVLLCLGVFLLSWPAGGSEVSAALAGAGAPHAEQAANSDGNPLDGDPLDVFTAVGEDGDRLPKNAVLLRTLVFVHFFGLALGWLVVSGWMRRRPEACSPIRCWFHSMVHLHQQRGIATLFLGVFRL